MLKNTKAATGSCGFIEKMAATYSRASYTCTTIGNAAFDGRVRDGIGSDHSFTATRKTCFKEPRGGFVENYTWNSVATSESPFEIVKRRSSLTTY